MAENLRVNYGTEVSADEVYTSGVGGSGLLEVSFQREPCLWSSGKKRLKIKLKQLDIRLFLKSQKSYWQSLDRNVTYKDLETATLAIRSGATYIVTNIDSNLPSEKAQSPGSGAITGFLKVATQVEPIIIGKPSSVIMESALDYFKC